MDTSSSCSSIRHVVHCNQPRFLLSVASVYSCRRAKPRIIGAASQRPQRPNVVSDRQEFLQLSPSLLGNITRLSSLKQFAISLVCENYPSTVPSNRHSLIWHLQGFSDYPRRIWTTFELIVPSAVGVEMVSLASSPSRSSQRWHLPCSRCRSRYFGQFFGAFGNSLESLSFVTILTITSGMHRSINMTVMTTPRRMCKGVSYYVSVLYLKECTGRFRRRTCDRRILHIIMASSNCVSRNNTGSRTNSTCKNRGTQKSSRSKIMFHSCGYMLIGYKRSR